MRIEGRAHAQQRRQQLQIERRKIAQVESALVRVFVADNLASDVLQRAHPVPIGGDPIESKRQALCGCAVHVQTLFTERGVHVLAMIVHPMCQQDDLGQPQHDDQESKHVFLHLKFRRLKTNVAPANSTTR